MVVCVALCGRVLQFDCDEGGSSNNADDSCVNNSKRCSGNDLHVCSNNSWTLVQTCTHGCDAENKVCKSEDGKSSCVSNDKRCDVNDLQVRANNSWVLVQTCTNGCDAAKKTCASEGGGSEGGGSSCTDNEKRCDGDTLRRRVESLRRMRTWMRFCQERMHIQTKWSGLFGRRTTLQWKHAANLLWRRVGRLPKMRTCL